MSENGTTACLCEIANDFISAVECRTGAKLRTRPSMTTRWFTSWVPALWWVPTNTVGRAAFSLAERGLTFLGGIRHGRMGDLETRKWSWFCRPSQMEKTNIKNYLQAEVRHGPTNHVTKKRTSSIELVAYRMNPANTSTKTATCKQRGSIWRHFREDFTHAVQRITSGLNRRVLSFQSSAIVSRGGRRWQFCKSTPSVNWAFFI